MNQILASLLLSTHFLQEGTPLRVTVKDAPADTQVCVELIGTPDSVWAERSSCEPAWRRYHWFDWRVPEGEYEIRARIVYPDGSSRVTPYQPLVVLERNPD